MSETMNDTGAASGDTASLPAATNPSSTPAPLDPVIMKMLGGLVPFVVWPYVDNEATELKLEEKKKAEPHLAWKWEHCKIYTRDTTEIAAARAIINNLNPQDGIEAILASQIPAVYFASMECLNKASWADCTIENRVSYLNTASKLSRTLSELTKAFDHHRGKSVSEQKITVQHIHINNGAQAVIGNVNSPTEGGAGQNEQ